MKLPTTTPSTIPKLKQANCRLTDAQAATLKRHCVQTGLSASDVIVAGLAATVPGFPQ